MITPPSPDARLTPEQIEERLARQRRELAADVDALAERVAPQAAEPRRPAHAPAGPP